jgi:hypothetical protein
VVQEPEGVAIRSLTLGRGVDGPARAVDDERGVEAEAVIDIAEEGFLTVPGDAPS